MKECHKCPYNGKNDNHCLSCCGDETYDYKYQHYILDTYDPVQPDTSGSEQVTNFDDDLEDKLRKILTIIRDLTPNELLLIQSICKGENLTEYGQKVEQIAKKNQTFSRFRAFQTRKSIIRKLGEQFSAALLTRGQKKVLKLK